MAREKYKNSEERKQARNAQIQRYKAEKTKEIRANLPPEYTEKIEYITKELNISRAQYIKNCIDTTYNELTGGKDMQKD